MTIEVGIVLDLSPHADPPGVPDLDALARRAEAGDLDLVVVRGDPAAGGLDPWTVAVWLAGRTERIPIAVDTPPTGTDATNADPTSADPTDADPTNAEPTSTRSANPDPTGTDSAPPAPTPVDPTVPYPTVVAKARQSLDILAGARLLTPEAGWVTVPAGTDPAVLRERARIGVPVVVPVRSVADVDRLIAALGRTTEAGTIEAGATGAPTTEARATGTPTTEARAGGAGATGAGHPDRSARPRRTAAQRARRRPGIDYDGVPASLAGTAVEPGDPAYRSVASTYLRGGAPGLVLRPEDPGQVADALAFARRHRHLPLGIRSGGHGISGRSTNHGGLVIDLRRLNAIEVLDPARRLVRVGPGATWKQVAAALDPYGWALGSGDYGGVGVGGLATAGGIGYLSRRYGLTIDRLRAVELVLADGTPVRASREENPDLFWAVRGAGANFGVATAFEFEVHELREVGFAQLILLPSDLEAALRRYGELASTAPRDTTVFLVTGRPRAGQSVIQLYGLVDSPDPDVIVARLTPFADLGLLAQQHVVRARYADVMNLAADVGPDGHQGLGEPVSRSAFLPALTDAFARDAVELLRGGRVYFFQLRAMGGAIGDVPAEETAFSYRAAAFQVTAMGANQTALNAAWDPLRHHFDGLYLSFDTDLRPERLADAFPPPVLTRLRELKRRYDPDHLFRDNFTIDPARDHDLAPAGSKESDR